MESFLRDEDVQDVVIPLDRQQILAYADEHGAEAALDRILSIIGASKEFEKRARPDGGVMHVYPHLTVRGSGNSGPLTGRGDDDNKAKEDAFFRSVYPKRAQSKDPTIPHSPGIEDPTACLILDIPSAWDEPELPKKIIKWNSRPNGVTAG